MQELMKFQGNDVELLKVNNVVYFNPYDVGRCLELCDSAVRMALSKMNEKQVVLLKNSDVNKIDTRKLNNAGEKFLTECGVYKLIFKSNKPKAEEFANWVTDEVLPAINHTGKYEVKPAYQQQQLEEYNYTPKYYNGIQVVSISDIAYFLKANRSMIQYHIKHNRLFKKNKDYYLVEKAEMAKFKIDNPSVSPLANCMYVITKSGYIKLMKLYNQSENLIEFKTLEEPKEKTSIKKNVPIREDKVIQEVIRRSNEEMTALKLSIEKFNAYNSEDDFHFYQEMMKEFINSLVRSVSVLVHAEVAI